jgi:thioredoxin
VDLNRLAARPKCAQCAHPIQLDRPVAATEQDLEETIRTASVPIVVDFYADWCGPCRAMAPHVNAFAGTHAGQVLVLKVDTDHNPSVLERYGIRGIPTLIGFRNGHEAGRHVGMAAPTVLASLAGL